MSKLPWLQLFPADWLSDALAGCSLGAQGLWLRMMFIMHTSERYGYLVQNGTAIPSGSIARRCGCTPEQYATLLDELDTAGVPSRTSDGTIFSRRMVRDQARRDKNRDRMKDVRTLCSPCAREKSEVRDQRSEESQKLGGSAASFPQSPSKKATPRRRYATIGELAEAAVSIWASNRTIPGYTAVDWKEDLKTYAAQNGLEYSDNLAGAASPIEQAITIASERFKGA